MKRKLLRQCGECGEDRDVIGFRGGLCKRCFKDRCRDVPEENLLEALHLLIGCSMSRATTQRARDLLTPR